MCNVINMLNYSENSNITNFREWCSIFCCHPISKHYRNKSVPPHSCLSQFKYTNPSLAFKKSNLVYTPHCLGYNIYIFHK